MSGQFVYCIVKVFNSSFCGNFVASLDLSVVPRSSRTNQLMLDVVVVTENIKGMSTSCPYEMCKFCAVVGLDRLGSIAKEGDRALYKVDSRESAVLLISVDETFSGRFLKHCVLIEFLAILACIADFGDEFYVYLPFDSDHSGCIVGLAMLGLFLCRLDIFAESKANKHAV